MATTYCSFRSRGAHAPSRGRDGALAFAPAGTTVAFYRDNGCHSYVSQCHGPSNDECHKSEFCSASANEFRTAGKQLHLRDHDPHNQHAAFTNNSRVPSAVTGGYFAIESHAPRSNWSRYGSYEAFPNPSSYKKGRTISTEMSPTHFRSPLPPKPMSLAT
jgi:hypothetical protein